ncbi:MAG TPA: pyridine nucleotide-disulfide oxidoreductase [Aliiroseovarius sp.]|nr:pyridine nucleotide-disulfide oxidoreductase [Aliiroseovarius sp.]
MKRVVVIGAGQAGASLVAKLRARGFDGAITLVGDEPFPPYQRPPLSKAYLLGQMERERLFLRPEEWYADQAITLKTGTRVTAIDPAARKVELPGEMLDYDMLALVTGSVPNRLPAAIGGDLDGVHVVRGLADIDRLAPEFDAGRHVLIVGGGYIGLEAAAVAAQKGLRVTLVEAGERILGRVASPETSDYFRALHRTHGVDIREGLGLERLEGDGRVSAARLSDGSTLSVDFVIAGIGVRPATDLAEAAGLALENGIRVDAMGQTSDAHIWAAGDVTSFPWKDTRIRLESVPNAIDQAEAVADNMLGAGQPYQAKPWFWSDQYDVKLQMAGLNTGYDDVVTRPGAKDGAVSFWYFRGGELLAVEAMNEPRAYMVGKRLIEAGASPDKAVLADPAGDLKALL